MFDFNVHLPEEPDQEQDFNIVDYQLKKQLQQTVKHVHEKELDGANICLLDSRAIPNLGQRYVNRLAERDIYLTVLVDPGCEDVEEQVNRAGDIGFRGIKFHPYHQNLVPDSYERVRKAASVASNRGMWIAICGSYGTNKVFRINAVELLIEVCQIVKTPIVLLHAGGKRILEAMTVALENDNVFIETSFSLSFWKGSSLEQDFAFAFKKLGCERILYGSDHPYVPFDKSSQITEKFFRRFEFSEEEIDQVMTKTVKSLISY